MERFSFLTQSLSLSEPYGTDPLVAFVVWVEGAMLGTVANAIAVIAVSFVGILMFTGRLHWRRGATVIVGCFVLFGAASMAAGITALSGGADFFVPPAAALPPDLNQAMDLRERSPPPGNYDPYAGAAPARESTPIR